MDISAATDGAYSVLSFPPEQERVELQMVQSLNLLYIKGVRVNGQVIPGWWLVDTGAEVSVLDQKHAASLKLPRIRDVEKIREEGMSMAPHRIDSLAVGDVSLTNHAIAVIDLSQFSTGVDLAGIIGSDVLGRLPFSVDYEKNVLTFYNPRIFEAPEDGTAVRFTLSMEGIEGGPFTMPGSPIVQARLDDQTDCRLVLDTGFSRGVSLAGAFAAEHPEYIQQADGVRRTTATPAGVKEIVATSIGRLHVLGHSFESPTQHAEAGGAGTNPVDGTLGGDLLKEFRLTFDYGSKTVWVQHRPTLSVEEQLARGLITPGQVGIRGMTPLHTAALLADVAAFEAIVAAGGRADILGDGESHLLHYAAEGASPAIIARVLELAPDAIDARTAEGATPVMIASQHASGEVVRRLIDGGAATDLTDEGNRTAIHFAVRGRNLPAVKVLTEAGADPNALTKTGATPLDMSAFLGYATIFRALEANGGEPSNAADGPSLLHFATMGGDAALVQHIIDTYEIDLESRMPGGVTPLHVAAGNGRDEAMAVLIEAGADVEATNDQGATAAHMAAENSPVNGLVMLAEAGAELDRARPDGLTPILFAVASGNVDGFNALRSYGVELDVKVQGYSILHLAAQGGATDIIKYVLGAVDIDINVRASNGTTPLHLAVESNRLDAVAMVLDAGADPSAVANDGSTPLLRSIDMGQIRISRMLIEAGADIEMRAGNNAATPLLLASARGHDEIVALLLAAEASPSAQIKDGRTSLHIAAQDGRLTIARKLIAAGADVNLSAGPGLTPLMLASARGYKDVVACLLDGGADPSAQDASGKTALDLANERGRSDIIDLLSQGMEE